MKTKSYFPMFIDLENKKIVVVGGGRIATRRVRTLLEFSRDITVVAPNITDEIDILFVTGKIHLLKRKVQQQDFQGAFMVIAATDDGRLNDDIANYCRHQGIYVNVASDKDKCDFHFPGIIKREEIVIGINASGVNHKKAKLVRRQLEEFFARKDEKREERRKKASRREP